MSVRYFRCAICDEPIKPDTPRKWLHGKAYHRKCAMKSFGDDVVLGIDPLIASPSRNEITKSTAAALVSNSIDLIDQVLRKQMGALLEEVVVQLDLQHDRCKIYKKLVRLFEDTLELGSPIDRTRWLTLIEQARDEEQALMKTRETEK